jgi:site-specific recombinase XerD
MSDQSKNWDEAIDEFIAWMPGEERSPLTIQNYTDDLDQFTSWHRAAKGEAPRLDRLSKADLVEWKQSLVARKATHAKDNRTLAAATVNRKLAAVGAFLKWASLEKRYCQPIGRPKKERTGRQPPKWLIRNEKNLLLRTVEDGGKVDHYAMVTLLLNTGLRVSELAKLKWSKVIMGERKGKIEVEGKGRMRRTIPLNSDALKALKTLGWKTEKGKDSLVFPVTIRGIQFLVENYGKKAGLELSVHQLRHTFAHDLLTSVPPTPLNQVQEMLGHASPVTTMLYLLPSEAELAATVERITIDPDDAPPPAAGRQSRRRR